MLASSSLIAGTIVQYGLSFRRLWIKRRFMREPHVKTGVAFTIFNLAAFLFVNELMCQPLVCPSGLDLLRFGLSHLYIIGAVGLSLRHTKYSTLFLDSTLPCAYLYFFGAFSFQTAFVIESRFT